MKIETVTLRDFRNIPSLTFSPEEFTTVISGENGQGKTNLLESLWLLTGSKSFRAARDQELVMLGKSQANIIARLCPVKEDETEKEIEILVYGEGGGRRGRFARINGVDYGRAANIAGIFNAVVFDPGHLNLVRGGPDGRRKFLDAALCQVYPGFIGNIRRYQKALTQKNAVLKNYRITPDADYLLDAFDAELTASGEEITKKRHAYLEAVSGFARIFYAELSSNKESLLVQYMPSCAVGELPALLAHSRRADVAAGFSTKGPHREDFDILINERSARTFASRGQQRSAVLALKLSEASQILQITGNEPAMLLDDVLSELDEERQTYFLSRIGSRQCVITTCDHAAFGKAGGKIVTMRAGKLVEE